MRKVSESVKSGFLTIRVLLGEEKVKPIQFLAFSILLGSPHGIEDTPSDLADIP